MNAEELTDSLEEEFVARVDTATIDHGIGKRDAAGVYRALAVSFRHRAEQLDDEAHADGD